MTAARGEAGAKPGRRRGLAPCGPLRLASTAAGAKMAAMAAETEEPLALDYPGMVHAALRDVPRRALAQVAEEGLPGDHHFVLAFKTRAPGVRLPKFLLDLHPEEMTVVLQHQFWDLYVDREAFSVVLAFGGSRQPITVPFAALTAFADPSVPFGLRFDAPGDEPAGAEMGGETAAGPSAAPEPPQAETAEPPGDDANVVRFDRFRKKD